MDIFLILIIYVSCVHRNVIHVKLQAPIAWHVQMDFSKIIAYSVSNAPSSVVPVKIPIIFVYHVTLDIILKIMLV